MLPWMFLAFAVFAFSCGFTLPLRSALLTVGAVNMLVWGYIGITASPALGRSYWFGAVLFTVLQLPLVPIARRFGTRWNRSKAERLQPFEAISGVTATASREIDAPASVIFPHVTRPGLIERWQMGLVGSESLSDGDPRPGFRFRTDVHFSGRRTTLEHILIEVVPDRLVVAQEHAKWYRLQQTIALHAREGTTLVQLEQVMSYKGLYKLIHLPIRIHRKSYERDRLKKDLERLNRVVREPSIELPKIRWTRTDVVLLVWQLALGVAIGWILAIGLGVVL